MSVSREARPRLETVGGWRRTCVFSEEAKMAELHYMEMGWSGSGWMDPLPMENIPSSAPSSSPSSYNDFKEPPARAKPARPRRKAAKKTAKKSSRKKAKKSAKKGARRSSAKKTARKSAKKSAKRGKSARKRSARPASRKRGK
jgi:hypothetical protein